MKEQSSLSHSYEIGLEIAKFEIQVEKESQATKKTYYLALFNDLLSNNVPKEEVVRKAHEIIEKALQTITKDSNTRFNNDSYFYRIARENNYESSVQEHSDNSSPFVPEVIGDYKEERLRYYYVFRDIKKLAEQCMTILPEDHYIEHDESGNQFDIKIGWKEFIELDGRKEFLDQICNMIEAEKKEWQQMLDTRQSILPSMRFLVTALTSLVTNKDLCTNYFAVIKNKMLITPKKLTQFLNDCFTTGTMAGETANSRSQLFSKVMEDSVKWNFIDIQCPKCNQKSMKIKLLESGEWVFCCKNWDYHKSDEVYFPASLFQERIKTLSINDGGASTKYLKKLGIDVKSN